MSEVLALSRVGINRVWLPPILFSWSADQEKRFFSSRASPLFFLIYTEFDGHPQRNNPGGEFSHKGTPASQLRSFDVDGPYQLDGTAAEQSNDGGVEQGDLIREMRTTSSPLC